MRESEVDYAVKAIEARPENESSWRYLQGLYHEDFVSWVNDTRVSSLCLKILGTEHSHIFALRMLLDLILHGFQPNQEFKDAVNALSASDLDSKLMETGSDLAKTVCSVLEHKDPIRANYWSWRKSKLPQAG